MSNQLVRAAIVSTVAMKGFDHFRRPAGSFLEGVPAKTDGEAVVGFLLKLLRTVEVEDVTHQVEALGACRYYKIQSDLINGYESVCLLGDLTPEELGRCRFQIGHHGNIEIVMPDLPPRPTDIIHILVADTSVWPPVSPPNEDTARMVTWFPGRITPPVDIGRATVKKA
jgi:hypothetical protein